MKNSCDVQNRELAMKLEMLRFNPCKATNLLPMFDKDDLDGYFHTIERIAKKNYWPTDQWRTVLVPKLTGKAHNIFYALEQPDDYQLDKQSILADYVIIQAGFRQKFKKLTKPISQTIVEFAQKLRRYYNKWLKGTRTTIFDDLVNLIVIEQCKSRLSFFFLGILKIEERKTLER